MSSGFVYAISNGRGAVKIGWSKDPLKRHKYLQTAHTDKLTILGVKEGSASDETALHDSFANFRLRGEWFRLEGRVCQFVAQLSPPPSKTISTCDRACAGPLANFIGNARGRVTEFARELGVSKGAVHDLITGRRKPGLELATKIEKATAGKVPAASWHSETVA